MIPTNTFLKIFAAFSLMVLLACNPDESGGSMSDPCNPEFDQSAFFTHLRNNIIQPGYDELVVSLQHLEDKRDEFLLSLNEEKLLDFRITFNQAYIEWQSVAMYEFEPAKEVFLRNSLNNFPLNEEQLLENIQTGIYDFDMPDRFDKGFPALDYLLYGIGDNNDEIVNKYIIGANAENYRTYLTALIDDMLQRAKFTQESWANSYGSTFVNSKGTAAGTSLSLIINGFNENYELIKREKLGVPSGVLTLGIPNADRVEAIHSGLSTTLLKTAFNASFNLYKGIGRMNSEGLGLDDYLNAANAKKSDALLSDIITTQFETTETAINNLTNSLDAEITADKEKVVQVYNEVTRQLVNIKTDMPSVLCVSITYIDNPSDSD